VVKGKAHFVEADIPGLSQWIFVPPHKRGQAQAKDLVKCKLTQHPIKNGKAQASVLDVLGSEQDAGIEWTYSIQKNALATQWSKEALAELEDIGVEQLEHVAEQRIDLSDIPFVTIDSPTTRDMDDALYCEKTDDGWHLKVAIADPVALVKEGSVLENEIVSRGASVYFPGKQVAMLPEALASDLCSLVEGQKRLAKVIELDIDSNGESRLVAINAAVICSSRKLSYQEAAELTAQPGQSPMLDELEALTRILHTWRQKNALVQADKTEFFIELNEHQKIQALHPKPSTTAHRIVEECMLLVNNAVANWFVEQELPGVFVSHTGVRSDRLESLDKVFQEKSVIAEDATLADPSTFSAALRQCREQEALSSLALLLTKQLDRTTLSGTPESHFGLGFSVYTTVTSPIRKAQDYLMHRLLEKHLSKQAIQAIPVEVIEQIDEKTQRARGAVFDVEQWLKCQFMAKNSEVLEAEVLRVFASGVQVRLLENGIEGFIATRDLEGKYSYNQSTMELKGQDMAFYLGQTLKVKKKLVDWSRKQIMMQPA